MLRQAANAFWHELGALPRFKPKSKSIHFGELLDSQ